MRYRLVCFDVDGTLIDDINFIWQLLHEQIGSDPDKLTQYKRRYFSGQMTYDQWARSDVLLWQEKGATKQTLMAALEPLKLMPGARETLTTLKASGYDLGIVSGSLNIALELLIPDYQSYFTSVYLNQLTFDAAGAISSIEPTPYDMDRKADGLRAIASKLGVPLSQTVFVGDHFNDVAVAKIAGLAIAFNSKSPELEAVCHAVITDKNLTNILPLIMGK